MISAVHATVFAADADAARAFFRDMLQLESVDAGGGWLIFALPPAELAVHPTEGQSHIELYLMCDDIRATIDDLTAKGVELAQEVTDEGWGLLTQLRVPGLGKIGLYEPRHLSPIPSA